LNLVDKAVGLTEGKYKVRISVGGETFHSSEATWSNEEVSWNEVFETFSFLFIIKTYSSYFIDLIQQNFNSNVDEENVLELKLSVTHTDDQFQTLQIANIEIPLSTAYNGITSHQPYPLTGPRDTKGEIFVKLFFSPKNF